MKRFRFRLEKVRSVREVQERQAAAAVAAARRAEAEVAAALAGHRADLAGRGAGPGTRPAPAMAAGHGLVDLGHDVLRRTGVELTAAADLAAERTAEWAQAARRLRALELLEDRRRAEHALEVARDEAARVDDLVSARAATNQEEHT